MNELVCLRCDWTGDGDGSACPRCGTSLYRINTSPGVDAPSDDGALPAPSASAHPDRRWAAIVVALVAAVTTFVFVSRDAPEAPATGRARETPSLAGPPRATAFVFDGCAGTPKPPGRVQTPSEHDRAAAAASLTADYRFRNSLASSVGTAPDLVETGSGAVRFAGESVRGRTRPVLRFGRGRGLSLAPTTGIIANDAFTIELLFRFDRLAGYRKVIDFKSVPDTSGLYGLDGCLTFYPRPPASPATIGADTYVQVVLTRDASAKVVGYVDGIRQFTFRDMGALAEVDTGDTLQFFGHGAGTQTRSSGGAVSRIRLYDRALVGSEVAALACTDLPAWFCS